MIETLLGQRVLHLMTDSDGTLRNGLIFVTTSGGASLRVLWNNGVIVEARLDVGGDVFPGAPTDHPDGRRGVSERESS